MSKVAKPARTKYAKTRQREQSVTTAVRAAATGKFVTPAQAEGDPKRPNSEITASPTRRSLEGRSVGVGIKLGIPKREPRKTPWAAVQHRQSAVISEKTVAMIEKIASRKTRLGPVIAQENLGERLVAEVERQGPDVAALCERYGLKRAELGRLTGFSLRALAEWSSGRLPGQPAQRRLQEVRRLLDALSGLVQRESIPNWLHQPNPAFERLTPLQVIELGEIDRLWAMVHELGSGQPS